MGKKAVNKVKEPKDNRSTKTWDSIYRQWISGRSLATHFGNALAEKRLDLSGDFTVKPYWMFMSLWYGVLFGIYLLDTLEMEARK